MNRTDDRAALAAQVEALAAQVARLAKLVESLESTSLAVDAVYKAGFTCGEVSARTTGALLASWEEGFRAGQSPRGRRDRRGLRAVGCGDTPGGTA